MKHRLFFAGLALTIAASIVLNVGIHFYADASSSEPVAEETMPKNFSRPSPIIFARFEKTNLSLFPETNDDRHCEQSAAFQNGQIAHPSESIVDTCAPMPVLITNKGQKKINQNLWNLPVAPERIIWQQDLPDGHTLTVDIIDSDNLPWPARFESSKLGNTETIQVIPSYELHADRDMHLTARINNDSGEIIENWVLAVRLKNGATGSVPWSAK